MVRHFKPDPIPREKLERIAAAAQRAPSAGFSQGQRIVVVTERAQMKRVADIAGEPIYVSQGDHPWLSTCGAQIALASASGCTTSATSGRTNSNRAPRGGMADLGSGFPTTSSRLG